MAGLPRIGLMLGPGTLPSQGLDRLDLARYRKSGRERLSGEELLALVPEIRTVAQVHVDEGNPYAIARVEDLRALALRMKALFAQDEADGIVFVQGTNSVEETAFFLDVTLRSTRPIAVTGSQRPFTALSSDAPLNLYDAFRVAGHPGSIGKGVLVVANGEINAARDVTKTDTYRLQTFRSREAGLLGYADADRIVYYRSVNRDPGESGLDPALGPLPRVDILYVSVASDPGLAQAALALGAQGLVVAGSGAGACGNLEEELAAIAVSGRAVVVRSSRVGSGRVIRDDNWQSAGMVSADNLGPHKAALLLALALARTRDPEEIQRLFDRC